jgi:hypothetical protein
MRKLFLQSLLVFSIILFLPRLEAAAAPRQDCVVEPAPGLLSDPTVTSSLPNRGPSSALLDFIASIAVPGIERFSAADYFQEYQSPFQLQIAWLGDNFRKHFLSEIEVNVRAGVLDVYRLRQPARDDSIIAALGGQRDATLYDVWTLINCQSQGRISLLLTDGTPNFFYVRDSAGVAWAVDAVWGGAGWEIGASSLQDPRPWGRGRQIILRRP